MIGKEHISTLPITTVLPSGIQVISEPHSTRIININELFKRQFTTPTIQVKFNDVGWSNGIWFEQVTNIQLVDSQ